MGAIYAAAAQVIVWLDKNKPIADFFRVWNEGGTIVSTESW
jgi:hypothetical protein